MKNVTKIQKQLDEMSILMSNDKNEINSHKQNESTISNLKKDCHEFICMNGKELTDFVNPFKAMDLTTHVFYCVKEIDDPKFKFKEEKHIVDAIVCEVFSHYIRVMYYDEKNILRMSTVDILHKR